MNAVRRHEAELQRAVKEMYALAPESTLIRQKCVAVTSDGFRARRPALGLVHHVREMRGRRLAVHLEDASTRAEIAVDLVGRLRFQASPSFGRPLCTSASYLHYHRHDKSATEEMHHGLNGNGYGTALAHTRI